MPQVNCNIIQNINDQMLSITDHYLKRHSFVNTGDAYRKCLLSGSWAEPNFDSCVDEVYDNILNEVSRTLCLWLPSHHLKSDFLELKVIN